MIACTISDFDFSAGITDAVRAVDCLAQKATAQAFDRLFGTHGGFATALTAILTIFVAVFAFRLLTGRGSVSLAALAPQVMMIGLVLTFATSWNAYSRVVWTLLAAGPDEIATVIVGGKESATFSFTMEIDRIVGLVSEAAITAGAAQPDPSQASLGFARPAQLLGLSSIMLLLGTAGVLLTSRIVLAAIMTVGPAFIVLALFDGTRGLFEGWLKAAVLFAVIPLLAVLMGGGALVLLTPLFEAAELSGGAGMSQTALSVFLGASVYLTVMVLILYVAAVFTLGWRLPRLGARFASARASNENVSLPPAHPVHPMVAAPAGHHAHLAAARNVVETTASALSLPGVVALRHQVHAPIYSSDDNSAARSRLTHRRDVVPAGSQSRIIPFRSAEKRNET